MSWKRSAWTQRPRGDVDSRFKQFVKQFGFVKRLVGWQRARGTVAFAKWWESILKAEDLPAAEDDHPILLATSLGAWQPGTRLDSVLSVALRLRGAQVHAWLCDEALPACQLTDAYFYPDQSRLLRDGPRRDMCRTCFSPALGLFESLQVPVQRIGALLSPEEARSVDEITTGIESSQIPAFMLQGIPIGEHAVSGALRFFARGDLEGEPRGADILRAYLRSALITFHSIRRALAQNNYRCVVLHHGIYIPQGIIAEVCRQVGVRVVTWHPAYRRNCFTFAEGDTYHRRMITEPISNWEDMAWSPAHDHALSNYLKSRWQGSQDWIHFNPDPQENLREIGAAVGFDSAKPSIGLLTTVMWDARLHYPTNAFGSVQEWVIETIRYFARRPELQLIIRIHPAEVHGRLPARHRIQEEINRAFTQLPGNVFVIPPESPISTYVLMQQCNAALIYATKTGIELTAMGIPVVVAGEAWIRNKGFSLDATSPADYVRILDTLPLSSRLDSAAIERARKYAFHYFFRKMIPLEFVHQASTRSLAFDISLNGLKSLMPGNSLGLDVICEDILNGGDFIYPAETLDLDMPIGEPAPHGTLM